MGGCTTSGLSSGAASQALHQLTDTRAFVTTRCPLTGEGPESIGRELGVTFLSSFVDKGFDLFAAAIRKAGEASTATVEATSSTYAYSLDQNMKVAPHKGLGCIVLIRGTFGPQDAEQGVEPDPEFDPDALTKFGLVGDPDFYFDGNLRFATDTAAFRVKSQQLWFVSPLKGSRRERDVVLGLEFKGLDGTVFASAAIRFDDLIAPTKLNAGALRGKETAWMPMSTVGEPYTSRLAKLTATSNALEALPRSEIGRTKKLR